MGGLNREVGEVLWEILLGVFCWGWKDIPDIKWQWHYFLEMSM